MPIAIPKIFQLVAWGVVAVLILAGACIMIEPLIAQQVRLQAQKHTLQAKNDAIEAEINELKRKQELFKTDPEFIEKIGREANQARPDEIIFVFPRPDNPRTD